MKKVTMKKKLDWNDGQKYKHNLNTDRENEKVCTRGKKANDAFLKSKRGGYQKDRKKFERQKMLGGVQGVKVTSHGSKKSTLLFAESCK